MFVLPFRNVALALAGAALIGNSLMAPVAAASDDVQSGEYETITMSRNVDLGERFEARQPIQVRTDIVVIPLGHERHQHGITYDFRVVNTGPAPAAKVTVERGATLKLLNGQVHASTALATSDVSLDVGESRDFKVECKSQATTFCATGWLKADALSDQNKANNEVYVSTPPA